LNLGCEVECLSSVDGVVEEIMSIQFHRSLHVRQGIDEVEAAKRVVLDVEMETRNEEKESEICLRIFNND